MQERGPSVWVGVMNGVASVSGGTVREVRVWDSRFQRLRGVCLGGLKPCSAVEDRSVSFRVGKGQSLFVCLADMLGMAGCCRSAAFQLFLGPPLQRTTYASRSVASDGMRFPGRSADVAPRS